MHEQYAIDLSDLPERKLTKVTVGETEMVLLRTGDRVKAFQATCPHAGAPLEQGAVCGDKLVCPWHKAVFQLSDGKLCEPLALADLKQYPLRIENGKVRITPKAMSPASFTAQAGHAPVWVVIGAGAAGCAAVWTLRHEGFSGRIILIEREENTPYDRTALSKFVPAGKMNIDDVPSPLTPQLLQQVDRIAAQVTHIDTQTQRIQLQDGREVPYDKLLIASGSEPVLPHLPGTHLDGVKVLRSREQARQLLEAVDEQQQLTLVGNSFIGLELAGALRNRDIAVTVVARQPLPFVAQFGEEIGHYFRQLHEANGVKFIQGEPERLLGDQHHHVTGLQLKQGGKIDTSLVLFATGVTPVTTFISQLPQLKDHSLQTDSFLQVAPQVWAAGDIASYPTARGPLRIEHYRVAQQQGRIAALNMLGQNLLYNRVPFFWTAHYGTRYEYLGHVEEWDEYLLLGSLEKKKCIALYGRGGQLAAAFSCGMYTLTAELVELMQQPMTLSQARATVQPYLP
ncbi:FAD-dependent oxidoreductase [Pantoea sp. A4]|uniref:FAD-dependent oxidoreductase n=1 Tax=Pantoea sp. A4 TaxID=1225184 RepID=UPI00035C0BBC|nr:FAD-dependent oxidoreductase [Pantoea sp. A4]